MNKKAPWVYFYCNALPESVRLERDIQTDSPAATRKVMAMSRALRAAGVHVLIVSMGRSANLSGNFHRARALRRNGQAIVVGPVWEVRFASRLISSLWLAAMALRFIRRRHRAARHFFYNQMSLYVPALVLVSALRQKSSVDIEDGPLTKRQSLSARFGANAPWLFERLITNGAVLAASRLAEGIRIRPVTTCYGAIPPPASIDPERFRRPDLHVLMAGFITRETGQIQFEQAIAHMRSLNDPAFDNLVFEVAGTGPGIAELKRLESGSRPSVRVLGRLDAADYAALLTRAHVGLSLKPVGGLVSETTFPSKTIEIAEHGLALITTDISDVREVFESSAWYLTDSSVPQLVETVRAALLDRDKTVQMAHLGQQRVAGLLSYRAVGAQLRELLFSEQVAAPTMASSSDGISRSTVGRAGIE